MDIVIGSDHAGFQLKQIIIKTLEEKGISFQDVGCFDESRVDYPDVSAQLAQKIRAHPNAKGILICGSGVGVAMAANRFPSLRAVTANDIYTAKMSRCHNDANVLCMGGRFIGADLALEILDTWLNTSFEGGRHQQRVEKLRHLNEKDTQPCST